jgi:hypothetical protein
VTPGRAEAGLANEDACSPAGLAHCRRGADVETVDGDHRARFDDPHRGREALHRGSGAALAGRANLSAPR